MIPRRPLTTAVGAATQAAAGRLEPPLDDAQRARLDQATRAAIQDLLTRLAIDG